MTSNLVRVMCWVMMVVCPAAMISADSSPAMLRGAGTVKVNGNAVDSSSVAYVGDKIETGKDSAVTITVKGGVVNLPANSTVVYVGNSIQMQQGRALVNTQKGLAGRLEKLTISPVSDRAKFQMTDVDGKALVAALEGSLSITDGKNTVLLTQGNTLMRTSMADEPPQGSSKEEPASPPPGKSRRHIAGWILIVGAVGGIIGGAAAAGVFESTSPSAP